MHEMDECMKLKHFKRVFNAVNKHRWKGREVGEQVVLRNCYVQSYRPLVASFSCVSRAKLVKRVTLGKRTGEGGSGDDDDDNGSYYDNGDNDNDDE